MIKRIKQIALLNLFLIIGFAPQLWSQSNIPGEDILHEKAQRKLQSIIKHSEAITGLVAIDLKTGETSFAIRPDFV